MWVGGHRHAPAALPPQETPGTRCTGGWVGPRAGLDRCEKYHPPTGIRFPDSPAHSESLYRLSYADPAFTTVLIFTVQITLDVCIQVSTVVSSFSQSIH